MTRRTLVMSLLLLAGCDQQQAGSVDPVPPPTDESANRLMGLAEQAAEAVDKEGAADRSTAQNTLDGERR